MTSLKVCLPLCLPALSTIPFSQLFLVSRLLLLPLLCVPLCCFCLFSSSFLASLSSSLLSSQASETVRAKLSPILSDVAARLELARDEAADCEHFLDAIRFHKALIGLRAVSARLLCAPIIDELQTACRDTERALRSFNLGLAQHSLDQLASRSDAYFQLVSAWRKAMSDTGGPACSTHGSDEEEEKAFAHANTAMRRATSPARIFASIRSVADLLADTVDTVEGKTKKQQRVVLPETVHHRLRDVRRAKPSTLTACLALLRMLVSVANQVIAHAPVELVSSKSASALSASMWSTTAERGAKTPITSYSRTPQSFHRAIATGGSELQSMATALIPATSQERSRTHDSTSTFSGYSSPPFSPSSPTRPSSGYSSTYGVESPRVSESTWLMVRVMLTNQKEAARARARKRTCCGVWSAVALFVSIGVFFAVFGTVKEWW